MAAAMLDFELRREADGRLAWRDAQGVDHVGLTVVRPFPLTAPEDGGLAVIDAHGHELRWIEPGTVLSPATQVLVDEALAERDFRPVVQRLLAVSTFSTPSFWTVATDRGETTFELKGEEQIRRLAGGRLLITSADGVTFEVIDRLALDRGSRKLLERFL